MARYSSSGLSSYSSYRSPYTDSSSSSYSSSSYTLPTYESKFESLISRADGKARSRAGTSTKYDYLSSYTSKYDFPSSYSSSASSYSPSSSSTYSPSSSKYDTTSSYGTSSGYGGTTSRYGTSSGYGGKSSLGGVDADDLTRSYFAKYYNKSNGDTSGHSADISTGRGSRALSVYLDDTASAVSTALEQPRTIRSNSVFDDPRKGRRFSRLLSTDDDVDSFTSTLTRRHSIAPRISKYSDREESSPYTPTSYTKISDREKDSTTSDDTLPRTRSRFLDRNKDEESKSPSYSRYSSIRDKEDDISPSSNYNRRLSTYNDDSAPAYRRDFTTRTYGGRTDTSDVDDAKPNYASTQNGYEKEGCGELVGGTGGLKNLGNTCFMNSVIQCLSNTALLVDYLLSDEYTNDINTTNSSMKGSLIKAFATVIKGLWKPAGRIVDPSSLKGAVQRFAPRFSGYNQEDSQEFLRYLLEGLHEDVNRVAVKPTPINTEIDSNISVGEQSMEAWKRYIRRDDSKLVDIFVGQLKSTLRCSTCDFESVTFEAFWDLSLPIPSRTGEVSLNECLEAFTKEEVMDGDEMPTCERCKTRRRCTKFYSLYKLPKVLVIHLKRFSPTERFRSKLGTTVTFPLTALDVAKFSDSPSRSTYSCYAVSNHSGTLYSGHYTAYARNPKTSEWNFFNDSRVSKSSSGSVISNEAYLLFFQLLS